MMRSRQRAKRSADKIPEVADDSESIESPVENDEELSLQHGDENEDEEEYEEDENDDEQNDSADSADDEEVEENEDEELEESEQLDEEMEDLEDDEEESEEEIDENDPFKPTTIVLAKVKGYPAWPAMVLKESLLPENILRKKPKQAKSKKKPTRSLPVRFFSDDTYIWINEQDMKILDNSMIQQYFNSASKKRRKDNLLEKAYQLAIDPPDMDVFVRYGSKTVPPEEEELELLLQPINEDDGVKPSQTKKRLGKPPAKKAKVTPKSNARKLADEKKKLEAKLLAEYDDDWGLDGIDGYDEESGNYIFTTKADQNRLKVSSTKLQKDLKRFQNRFQSIYNDLKKLLDEDMKESDIMDSLNELEKLLKEKSFPMTIFTKSKLLRLLILTARKPIEHFNHKKIKHAIDKLLKSALDLSVPMNKLEDLIIETDEDVVKQEEDVEEAAPDTAEDAQEAKDIAEGTSTSQETKDSLNETNNTQETTENSEETKETKDDTKEAQLNETNENKPADNATSSTVSGNKIDEAKIESRDATEPIQVV
mgnify:CR=1 FL=1